MLITALSSLFIVDDMSKFDIVLDNFDKVIGINKIGCIHVNDSKNDKVNDPP